MKKHMTDPKTGLHHELQGDYYVIAGENEVDMLSEFGILEDWVAANVPIFPIAYNNMMAATVPGVEGLVLAPTSNYMNFSTIYIVE